MPLNHDLETIEVMRQLNRANRKLAELRGVAQSYTRASEKEVMNYREALLAGFDEVKKNRILTLNTIIW